MIPEPMFEEFLAQNAGDIEEALVDLGDRFHRLLERLHVHQDDPIVENLHEYLFSDPL